MSEFLTNISQLITTCIIPFIDDLFVSSIGILFVGVACFVVVAKMVANLMHTKF